MIQIFILMIKFVQFIWSQLGGVGWGWGAWRWGTSSESPKPKLTTDIDLFLSEQLNKFMVCYESEKKSDFKGFYNTNVSLIFYDRKQLNEILKDENNEIESAWKRRIYIEYTPRGNIIMYYDVFKQAFSYYCDHSIVPHNLLNAVAMKYVMRYLCLNFFVDELCFPSNESPFVKMLENDDKVENEKKKNVFKNLSETTHISNLPFAKLKSAGAGGVVNGGIGNKVGGIGGGNVVGSGIGKGGSGIGGAGLKGRSGNSGKGEEKKDENENEKIGKEEKRINKFIYLGKINNFSILKTENKKNIFVKKMSYADYVKQKNNLK